MTNPTLVLRHICFTGPEKAPAKMEFSAGLNVIYGASDTGKSFVFDAIDFMLGGSRELPDIPERVGYDRIFLGIEAAGSSAFTLSRAVAGGQFHLYEGLHDSVPEKVEPKVLAPVHNAGKEGNLSRFLLAKVALDRRSVRKNASNETRTLSFRDLCHLCLVNETDIQKKGSPLETGQYQHKTVEYSIFKLLLTGVDDSALVSSARDAAMAQARAAKLEVIDELIANVQEKITESGDEPQELASQLERLQASVAREQRLLRATEEEYQALLSRRNQLRLNLENGTERRIEIEELLARFDLLDRHYESDLARLEAIREAGSLVAALAPQACPLCGTPPDQQHREEDCEGNLAHVVAAAEAESAKVVRLRRELAETVRQLSREAQGFDRLIPKMRGDSDRVESEIQEMRPNFAERRSAYTELVEERSSVQASLAVFDQLAVLQARKQDLERVPEGIAAAHASTELSTTTLDQFAQHVEKMLKAWNLPEAERVHFEVLDRDVVIKGKKRMSRGKGMRAITHAAFTVGLMEFCRTQNRQHPGFVVIDSPLLAYREPEGDEDDLTGTDVQDRFYAFLAGMSDRQVIILENLTPPNATIQRPSTMFFSKNPHQGRYGFFPTTTAEPSASTESAAS